MALNVDGDGVTGIGSHYRRTATVRFAMVRFESTLERGMHAEKASGTWETLWVPPLKTKLRNEFSHGIRILSHERGNPDTEADRSLNEGKRLIRRRRW